MPIAISKGRFEAFSDGVFAIAITLLVLEFHPPELRGATNAAMAHALLLLWPQYFVYTASFLTIGIMWFNHYALFHYAQEISYAALVANLTLLLFVAFLPFPTLLLGRYALLPAAVIYYGLTLIAIALCYGVLWYVATLPHDQRGSIAGYLRTRTVWNTLGVAVYSAGTLLALVSPIGSIILFAAMALYYMHPSSVRLALESTAAAR